MNEIPIGDDAYSPDTAVDRQLRALQRWPFELYARNPFRLAGAAHTAIELTELRALLDGAATRLALALGGEPRPDLLPGQINAELQELRDIRPHRFVAELFWFWPRGADDRAIALLGNGDLNAGQNDWGQSARSGSDKGAAIARHNLAVLTHFRALNDLIRVRDAKDALLPASGDGFAATRAALQRQMADALAMWRDVIGDDEFWEAAVERGAQIDRGTVSCNRVQAVRAALPDSLAELTLRVAYEFARSGLKRRAANRRGAEAARGEREIAYAEDLVKAASGIPAAHPDNMWKRLFAADRDAMANVINEIHTAATAVRYEPAKFDWKRMAAEEPKLAALALVTGADSARREQFLVPVGRAAYALSSWYRLRDHDWPAAEKEKVLRLLLALPVSEEYRKKIWTDPLQRAGDPPSADAVTANLRRAAGAAEPTSPRESDEPQTPEPVQPLRAEAAGFAVAFDRLRGREPAAFVAELGGGAGSLQERLREFRRQLLGLGDTGRAPAAQRLLTQVVARLAALADSATAAGDVDIAYGLLKFAAELGEAKAPGSDAESGAALESVKARQAALDKRLGADAACFFCGRPAPVAANHITVTALPPAPAKMALPLPGNFKFVIARCKPCADKHYWGWGALCVCIAVAVLWLMGQLSGGGTWLVLLLLGGVGYGLLRPLAESFFKVWGAITAPGNKHRLQTKEHVPYRQLVSRGWRIQWPY